jgi:hypothetical protein
VNRDITAVVAAVLAVALFAFVLWTTNAALRASGVWTPDTHTVGAAPDDPLTALDVVVANKGRAPDLGTLRDPFDLGGGGAPVVVVAPGPRKPVAPKPPPPPVLTAIVWDADPRAIVRWKDRNWTVHTGGLFDEFVVTSITRDQVTLTRGTETVVLQRKP